MTKEELELEQKFKKAVEDARNLEGRLPSDIMLVFYAYYKQATIGSLSLFNANLGRDIVSTFKFNAWRQLKNISKKEAKKEYIRLVEKYVDKK